MYPQVPKNWSLMMKSRRYMVGRQVLARTFVSSNRAGEKGYMEALVGCRSEE